MSDETQTLLRQVVELGPSEHDGAAMMWYYRNVLFFEKGLHQDDRVALLRYEDWVRQPQDKLEALSRFVGLSGSGPWMTRYIHGSSIRKTNLPPLLPEVEAACGRLLSRFLDMEHL